MKVLFVCVLLALVACVLCQDIVDTACPICEIAVRDVEKSLASNATNEEIAKVLSHVCDLLPREDKEKCLKGVQTVGNNTDESIVVKYSPFALCAIFGVCAIDCCATPVTPEQVHLSLTGRPGEMCVTWVTLNAMTRPMVQWGDSYGNYTQRAAGTSQAYTKGGWRGYVHSAIMTGLTATQRYYYSVGDPTLAQFWDDPNWSQPPLNFQAPPPVGTPGTSLAIIGDMGATDISDLTITHIGDLMRAGKVDFVFHVGDLSYADGYQALWDDMGRKVEVLAGYMPYMVCPGNHEAFFDFTPYLTRFRMPANESGSNTDMYHSFDYGNVHFISINTEDPLGVAPNTDLGPGGRQRAWIEADLQKAVANRGNVPWIVMMGHRPLYCSNAHNTDCLSYAQDFRTMLEPVIKQYEIDIMFVGHRHDYERSYPVFNNNVTNQSYEDPDNTVFVLNGSAGCKEHLMGGFTEPPPSWAAYRISQYGYGVLSAPDAAHLTWSFFDHTGNQLDTFTIVKTR